MSIQPTKPAPILPPGTFIEEWLEDENKTQREMAERLDVSTKHLNQVINGHKAISPTLAAKLATVTGYPAEFWLVHQAKYDARRTSLKVSIEDISQCKNTFSGQCLTRLRDAGLIRSSWQQPDTVITELFTLAKVASVKALHKLVNNSPQVAYRQSAAYQVKSAEVWTWLEIVKFEATQQSPLPDFSSAKLELAVPELKKITTESPTNFTSSVTNILNSCGVAFVAESDIEGARISGASFKMGSNPVIAVTDKQKREDVFWFTLFHEIAHVLAGDIDSVHLDLGDESELPDQEANADQWASDTLLPSSYVTQLLKSDRPTSAEIAETAQQHGISEAIVIGRIQHVLKDYQWRRSRIRSFEIPKS